MTQIQIEHLLKCKLCRIVRSKIDLHTNAGWSSDFCFDITLEILLEAYLNRNNAQPLYNGCPFINKQSDCDKNGGGYLEPGKGSHSTVRVPGTHFCQFRQNAGENAAKYFLLLKLCSSCDAGKGSIFIEFYKFKKYSPIILKGLRRFGRNNSTINYFEKAVSILKIYCRKSPNNLKPADKPSICATDLYTSIYNNSAIKLCNRCEPNSCTVSKDVLQVTEFIVKLLSTLEDASAIRLTHFLPAETVSVFKTTNCITENSKITLKSSTTFDVTQSLFLWVTRWHTSIACIALLIISMLLFFTLGLSCEISSHHTQ